MNKEFQHYNLWLFHSLRPAGYAIDYSVGTIDVLHKLKVSPTVASIVRLLKWDLVEPVQWV